MTVNQNQAFSIILPTFHEAKNIPPLISRLAELKSLLCPFEVIIVDDNSQDGIEEIVSELKREYSWLRLIIRKDKRRSLSASALEGFYQAQYPLLILMDADLSHPPEKIPELLSTLKDPEVDFVIGSRYVEGGSADAIWPLRRQLTSRFSAWIARCLVSAAIKDPLSGFFALRKSTLMSAASLQSKGWKIGLEIMMKCDCQHIKEIPIHFSQRLYGKSKLSLKVALEYLRHVCHLFLHKCSRRLLMSKGGAIDRRS